MIKEILERCSEAELGNILGWETLEFSKKITDDSLSIKNLSNAVYLSCGIDLVKSDMYRNLIISKMNHEQIKKYFEDLECEISGFERGIYENLKKLAKDHQEHFAKFLGMKEQWDVAELAKIPISDVTPIEPDYPLYPYQVEIANKSLELINNSDARRALMHLPTGSGKTRTALNIVCEHLRTNNKGLVVWLADSEELCSQALNEFEVAWKSLGNRRITSYSFFSDSPKSLGGISSGFLVAGLQRLNAIKKTKKLFLYENLQKNVSLVVFDEAHKAIAKTYGAIVDEFVSGSKHDAFVLGLTATPGRKFSDDDTEDIKLSNYFDNQKITMKVKGYLSPVTYLIENDYLAKPEFHSLNYESQIKINENMLQQNELSLLKKLSVIDDRNSSIIKQVIKEYKDNNIIIIFACGVDHSVELATTLCCLGYSASSLDSKNDSTETRRAKITDFKEGKLRIIVNYGVLTTGFDAPRTNVAIIARPTTSLVLYSQMIGRAMRGRKSGGNKKCKIYTVNDNIPEFMNVSIAFEHWDELWEET